jgi:hypothetical protein
MVARWPRRVPADQSTTDCPLRTGSAGRRVAGPGAGHRGEEVWDGAAHAVPAAVDAIRLSRRTLATIKAHLFRALAYHVAALPLAAAGLLNPMIAGAAMAASSCLVVSNSLRLTRFRGTARQPLLEGGA